MKWFLRAVLGSLFVVGLGASAWAADDKDAQAILDRAIKALGGQEKLSKVKAATWKVRSKYTPNDGNGDLSITVTVQGLDLYRLDVEREINGNKVKSVDVLAKDKGWRGGANETREMDENELAATKRSVYFLALPMTLVLLKGKGCKVEAAGEKKVGDKPAVGLKITRPDGKDFTLFFDKTSGLPVLLKAKITVVRTRRGTRDDFTMEATYADYKDFGGIKKATTIVWKRDGEKVTESHITEFRVLDKVDPKTFEEPK
jgi:hypothetical protein